MLTAAKIWAIRKLRFKTQIPIGGPLAPSTEKVTGTVRALREDYARYYQKSQALCREIEELGGHPCTAISHPDDVDFQKQVEGIYAETAAAFVVGIRQVAVNDGLSASAVDSIFLALLTPGYLEDVTLLGRQLSVVITGTDAGTPAAKVMTFREAIRLRTSAVWFFMGSLNYMAERYPVSPWAILEQVVAPLSFPLWYWRKKPARGPDPDVQSRIMVWGHLLVSAILGTQVEALRFWHSYCTSQPSAAGLSYSPPDHPPCSERAHCAFIVAKKRLFADLENAGIIAPVTLTGA